MQAQKPAFTQLVVYGYYSYTSFHLKPVQQFSFGLKPCFVTGQQYCSFND